MKNGATLHAQLNLLGFLFIFQLLSEESLKNGTFKPGVIVCVPVLIICLIQRQYGKNKHLRNGLYGSHKVGIAAVRYAPAPKRVVITYGLTREKAHIR